jgi:glycosyltransferase involved in cell wall biosynthesis
MNVLMIIDCFYPIPGGAQTHVRQIIPFLTANGCQVNVLTRRWQKSFPLFEKFEGIPVYRVGLPGRNVISTVSYILGIFWFIVMGRGQIDVIHTQSAVALGAVGKLAAILTGKKNVARISASSKIPRLQRNVLGRMILWLFKRTDMVVCLSEQIFQQLKSIHMNEKQILRLPNPVDTKRFFPAHTNQKKNWRLEKGFGQEDSVVVYIGRIVQEKGLELLFDVWKKITVSYPQARLLLVGKGIHYPGSLEEELQDRVRKEKLANVYFEGEVLHPEEYFNHGDIFILMSHHEGLSNALLEAMAAGNAIIASNIPANRGYIHHQQNGFLVECGDYQQFYQALQALINDRALQQTLGARAREFVTHRMSFELAARTLAENYRKILKSEI